MNATTVPGYTLQLLETTHDAAHEEWLRFRVLDRHGRVVTAFRESHGKRVHLIVVPHDLTSFQHVHPVMDEAGTWSVALAPLQSGRHRLFADVFPHGEATALTVWHDLHVPGGPEVRPLPPPTRTAITGRYEVALEGDLVAGVPSTLTFRILQDHHEVTDLQPYLGAYGHLVAIRDGDLAYAHVHPDGEPGDGRTRPGPTAAFHTELPRPGTYRLFLDFQHDGSVHTAAWTVPVEAVDHSTVPVVASAHHAHH
jgi:hypothetical protein